MKSEVYDFLPELFLRAPFYSYKKFDLAALPEVLQDLHFRNAIWLASPVFHRSLKGKNFEFEQLNEKEKFTLAKYFNRMCYRPTPFGSFATFTNLSWAGEGPVQLAADDQAILHLLPDRQNSTGNFNPKRRFNADTLLIRNPTIYRLGENFRFYSTSLGSKGRYRFSIDEVEAVDFNLRLLRLLADGPVSAEVVGHWILANADCTPEEANDYLRFLVEDQLLYTANQGWLISREAISGDHGQLTAAVPLERTVDEQFPEKTLKKAHYYSAAERPLLSGGLGADDEEELLAVCRVLEQLALPAPQEALKKFIADFQRRYDLEKVPLLKAIDPDTGISYGEGGASAAEQFLLADMHFPAPAPKTAMNWERLHPFFLRCWLDNQRRFWLDPILIGEELVKAIPAEGTVPLPPTVAVMFRKTGDQLLVESIGGSSATQLIGRFSQFSEAAWSTGRRIAAAEARANPGVVFADIEQLSDQYIDNINQRRPVYDYVIPLNVFPDLSREQQLLPEDLMLSVRSGELILESRRLGKRVIPRLASAYNYHHNELPLFRLLGDLQFQNLRANLGLDLAVLYPGLPFYPRVICRRTILCVAKWHLSAADSQALADALLSGIAAISVFRERLGLPALICVGQHDQQLVIDLTKEQEQALLLQWLKGKSGLIIREYLLPDRSVISDQKPLAGQFLGFLTQPRAVYSPLMKDIHRRGSVARKFIPGSDWLYIKLYCTPVSANILPEKLISPVMQKYRVHIRSWFFIRYSDPGFHLRLRVRVKGADAGQLLVALRVRLQKQQLTELVSEITCETYQREIERYGPLYILPAEAVFFAGSVLMAAFVSTNKPPVPGLTEFRLGLLSAHRMIQGFYKSLAAVITFTEEVTQSFLNEFQVDKTLKMDLDRKYRTLKPQIEQWLEEELIAADQGVQDAFNALQAQIRNVSARIPVKDVVVKKRILADLVHMQLNRTFLQGQRQQELLVYFCLRKYLLSVQARSKKTTQAG
jgi:thiopeptide-type bacteriocin biosynthesis protein